MDADGDFVVTWETRPPFQVFDVHMQRYNAAGVPQGGEVAVVPDDINHADVAMDADGNFVVAWEANSLTYLEVYAQLFNSAGVAQSGPIHVNTFTTERQEKPTVAMDADGDFVVTWQTTIQDDGSLTYGVYGQRFNATGTPQGDEFRVNTYTLGEQFDQKISMDAGGDFVVVWTSGAGPVGQDGSYAGVYAQRIPCRWIGRWRGISSSTLTRKVPNRTQPWR